MKKKTPITLSLTSRRSLYGIMFSMPFIIGFIFFYFMPLVRAAIYSFSKVSTDEMGMALSNVGFSNYNYVLFVTPDFYVSIFNNLAELLILVPCIIIFSLFIGIILNQKFAMRTFSRVIFFMPVILYSGLLATISFDVFTSTVSQAVTDTSSDTAALQLNLTKIILENMPFKEGFFIDIIETSASQIYRIVTSSGVQILIFLAGLQNIPPSVYEASNIEGATAWENFWKITLPILSPIILVNIVYTIIDTLSSSTNGVILQITNKIMQESEYGIASAMSIFYAIVILIVVVVVTLIVNKFTHYEN